MKIDARSRTPETARTAQRRRYTNRPQAANMDSHPFRAFALSLRGRARSFLELAELDHQPIEQVGARTRRALSLREQIRREATGRKPEQHTAGFEPIDRVVPPEQRVTQLDVALEVPPRARRIGVASCAERRGVEVRHEEEIRQRVAAGREALARGVALHGPLELAGLSRLEERPDVMELERIGVDDNQTISGLSFEDVLPPRNVSLDPEERGRTRLGRHGRVIGERLKKRVGTGVRSAPGRLARPARALDNDDHVWSNVTSGRSRKPSASGSAVAIPMTPATRNGPTQPAPRSSVTPATMG